MCRVPLPVWALVLMLLPASMLLFAVLFLPFVMGQWNVVLYTVAVFLLGISLYAALQLARRSGAVRFEHSDSLSQDRWRPSTLSLALAALPSFLVAVALRSALPKLHALRLGCCIAAAVLVISATLRVVVARALRREAEEFHGLHGDGAAAGGTGAAGAGMSGCLSGQLRSIPETDAGTQAPLMKAFLQDSLVSVEDGKALLEPSDSQSSLCEDGNVADEHVSLGGVSGGSAPEAPSLLDRR